MKYTRATALAAIGVAATLSLTACGGDESGASTASSSSASSADGGSDGGSKPEGGAGSEDTENKGASGDGGELESCKTDDLAIEAEGTQPSRAEVRINITMVNQGSAACSATGFPKVYIKDADNTSSPVGRGKAEPRITDLEPGDAAVFNLAYEPETSGESKALPTGIEVTPPNASGSVSLKWPGNLDNIKEYSDVEVYPTHTTK